MCRCLSTICFILLISVPVCPSMNADTDGVIYTYYSEPPHLFLTPHLKEEHSDHVA